MLGKETRVKWFALVTVFGFSLALVLPSCDLFGLKKQTGSLELTFSSVSSGAFFGPVLEVSSYAIKATNSANMKREETWSTSETHNLTGLSVGSWDVLIQGLDAQGIAIVQSSFSVEILAGQTINKVVLLMPIEEGTGTFALNVDWSSLDNHPVSPSVVASYMAADESHTQGTISMTVSGNSASGSCSLAAGYYILYLELKDAGSSVYLWNPQTFRIVKDVETVANIASNGMSEGGGETADVAMDLSVESVRKLDFKEKSSLKVKLENIPNGRLYLGKANNSVAAASAAATGKVATPTPVAKGIAKSQTTGEVKRFDHPRAQEFVPPPGISHKAIIPRTETISFGDQDPNMVVGTTMRAFWVESATGSWMQITARLRAASATSYIWIPDSYFSANSAVNNDNLLVLSQLTTLDDKFNGTGPVGGSGIRALVSNIFSTENGGEPGGNGGIDGDQHIHILLYDIDWDYSSGQTGGTLGYYWGKDEYPDSVMQDYGYRSNEAEMFYLDVHFTDHYPMMMISVLAHEYQHMINFNQKVLLRNVDSPTWFNEMCSMVSEDFVGSIQGIPDEDSPRSRIPRFNGYYYDSGVTDWLGGSSVLKSYASAYVFGAYLARNYGGAQLFHDMLCRSETGIQAVTASLQNLGTGTSFSDAFLDYTTAFVFDNPAPIGTKSFPALKSTYNGIVYDLPGFALSDYGSGPVLFDPGTQITLRPYGHSIHSMASWVDPSESSVITIEKPDDADVELYLMYVRR